VKLPDFLIPVTVDGVTRWMVARDVPTCLFFWGSGRGRVAFERWADELLARVVLEPRLTPDLVARFGRDRDEPLLAYFRAIGYYTPAMVASDVEAGARAGLAITDDFARPAAPHAAPALAVPFEALGLPRRRDLRAVLGRVARRSGTAPHVMWRKWTISQLCLSWRVLMDEEELAAVIEDGQDG
jgi:hypothetical protein